MTNPELNALFSLSESLTNLDDTLRATMESVKSLRRAMHLAAEGHGSSDAVREAVMNYRYAVREAITEAVELAEEAIDEAVSHFA